ncbi:MAG TPA: tetratricopeptide repeat protein [Panacibacter sp.]|nr:tetratricopeptide repeat protein [Panacibacter sp.]
MLNEKQILVLITQFFCGIVCFAQKEQIDSLKNLLPLLHDSARVNCLNKLSAEYYINALPQTYNYVQTDTARLFALEAYDLAEKNHYTIGTADALQNLGEIARDRGDYHTAENYFRNAIPLFEKINALEKFSWSSLTLGWSLHVQGKFNDAKAEYEKAMPYYLRINNKEKKAMLYRLISYTYSLQGYNEKAFENMLKAIRITREISDFRGSVSSPYNMGVLYEDAGETQTALVYYQLAAQNAITKGQPVRYNIITGNINALQNKPDSAIYYYKQSYYFVESLTTDSFMRKRELLIEGVNIGEMYLKQKKYDKALENFHKSLNFFEKGNDLIGMLDVLHKIADVYETEKMFSASFIYAKRLLDMAQATGARPFIRDGFELYWKIYDKQGKTDSAYKYHLKYISIKDSILKDEYLRNLALSEMKDKDEQQTAKINLLQKSQLIRQQQLSLQQQQLRSEALIRNVLIGSILFVFTLGIFIFRTISLKRKNESLQSKRVHAELQQKATKLEMQALRAQMNPHFIFNSLNSINRFILKKQSSEATEYLTKFSRLIRMILNSSANTSVSLAEDIEALKLYLELESLRFEEKFNYVIQYEPDLDIDFIQVPPMLLQPYIENAIWHGIMHKAGKGHLDIMISQKDNMLCCKITDDGIGRKEALALKSRSAVNYKSMGMRITADRIAMLHQQYQTENAVVVSDLILSNGNPGGTEVIIKIPLRYD